MLLNTWDKYQQTVIGMIGKLTHIIRRQDRSGMGLLKC